MHKISPNLKSKKVKFDSARVCFQVEYDIPDDKSLRQKIPIWTEHWKKSKTSFISHVLRSISLKQWLKVALLVVLSSILVYQLYIVVDAYLNFPLLLSGQYRREAHFHWPGVTLCTPIVIPFSARCNQSECQTIRAVFNQSVSQVFHRCKHNHVIPVKFKVCPKPIVWLKTDKKCFSYFTHGFHADQQLEHLPMDSAQQLALSFLIQTHDIHQQSVHLFVHQKTVIPFDEDNFQKIHVNPQMDLKISFFATKIISRSDPVNTCVDYPADRQMASQSDCHTRCLMTQMRAQCPTSDVFGQKHCLSRLAFIRDDLISAWDQFCTARDDNDCNSPQHYSQLEDECRHLCGDDCTKETFHLSVTEQLSSDASEINVSLFRQLTPDLVLKHVPQTTCLSLLGQLGGLIAFHLIVFWILLKVIQLFHYLFEFLEIYY